MKKENFITFLSEAFSLIFTSLSGKYYQFITRLQSWYVNLKVLNLPYFGLSLDWSRFHRQWVVFKGSVAIIGALTAILKSVLLLDGNLSSDSIQHAYLMYILMAYSSGVFTLVSEDESRIFWLDVCSSFLFTST